jgi:hypothetical protein
MLTRTSRTEVRWDFHRLMKVWQIDLYRYNVRLTYDLVIPEPGSYLVREYARLRELETVLGRRFGLALSGSTCTRATNCA